MNLVAIIAGTAFSAMSVLLIQQRRQTGKQLTLHHLALITALGIGGLLLLLLGSLPR